MPADLDGNELHVHPMLRNSVLLTRKREDDKMGRLLTALALVFVFSTSHVSACEPAMRSMRLPSKELRDKVLGEAGIIFEFKDRDAMAKDLFYMKGRYMNFERWADEYSYIIREKLVDMKAMLQKIHCDGKPVGN